MKRWCCLFIALLMLLCLRPSLAEGAPEGFVFVSQSGDIALYADTETGAIAVRDLRDGCLWLSNPEQPDAKAKGVHKMTLQSQVVIGYSSERGTALTATSYNDSVRRDGFHMEIKDGEIASTYDFPKQEISLTLRCRLIDGCLEARVPVSETNSYGLNTLTSVEVLPAFGAGGVDETGYLFIPDGCGALIRFNNGATAVNEYKANVYGKDPSVTGQLGLATSPALARTYEQTVRLPVFGINKGDRGFVAIITENDSKAVLHARVSNLTSYNYVYSEFQLLNSGSVIMNRKEFEQSIAGVSERKGLTTGDYAVRYCFLSGAAESGYVGMAARYRDYLTADMGLEKRADDNYPLYLDLYGYVDKTAHVLGIPYIKPVPLTTISDAREIVSGIGARGVAVRYRQFLSGNAYGKVPSSANIQSGLGTRKELSALDQWLRNGGGALYPDVDMVNVYKAGNGFRPLYDAVLAPVNSPQMQYQINYGNSKLDATVAPWYLMSPIKYAFFYQRYFDDYATLNIPSLSLSALGGTLTADNRTGGIGRQDALQKARETLFSAQDIGDVMIDGGNAYAAALASHVVGAPENSSLSMLADQTVPFWQIVFHGSLSYSLSPVNQSGDPALTTLKCLEFGASPLYAFVGRNAEQLMDSRMLLLFSGDWTQWDDFAKKQYAELSAVLSDLHDKPITGHEIISDSVRRTDYGDVSVYVNYGDAAYALEGVTVPAKGYAVKEAMGL